MKISFGSLMLSSLLAMAPAVLAEGLERSKPRGDSKEPLKSEVIRRVENSVYLGVFTVPLRSIHTRVKQGLRLAGNDGVIIAEVLAGSPAEQAGLREKDVITHVDGQPVVDQADLCTKLNHAGAGEKVRMSIVRRGEKHTVAARLEEAETDVITFLPYGKAGSAQDRSSSLSRMQQRRIEELEREVARLEKKLRAMEEATLARQR